MTLPDQSAASNAVRHDDRDAVPDEHHVIRYIAPDQLVDEADGSKRLSSAAFSPSSRRRAVRIRPCRPTISRR
jgi:hypothetical protein